jgi:hypothetical protein
MTDKTQHQPPSQEGNGPAKGANTDGAKLQENSKEKMDERLDEGVEETFPASDPVSVKITK